MWLSRESGLFRRHNLNTQSTQIIVTRELVPEDRRTAVAERLFGVHFPLRLEPVIYGITERTAKDYGGGYWDFFTLSNGGFYMAPASDVVFRVTCDNIYQGDLSGDALGITACLYAYSHLSFTGGGFARECARHYHRLREYMFEHPEVRAILGATD